MHDNNDITWPAKVRIVLEDGSEFMVIDCDEPPGGLTWFGKTWPLGPVRPAASWDTVDAVAVLLDARRPERSRR